MKLRYLADLRSLFFVAIYFTLLGVQWFAAPTSWLVGVPLFALTCIFSFFGAVITHNTIHSPVFYSRTINRVFQLLLSMTYGSAVSSFVPGHNLSHHKYTQSRKDVMRTTKVSGRYNLLNLMVFVPRVGLAIMRNDAAYTKAMKGTHRAWFRQYQAETFLVFAVTLALFVLDWKKALLYWQIPHLYAAWGIISMNYLQHDGCDVEHPYNHSRNFVGGFVNFLTFNNGYHGIHHDVPGLHWSLLPEAHAQRIHGRIDPRLEIQSMPAYLFRTFAWPGVRQSFDGKPLFVVDPGPDENWIPRPEETPEDLGAVAVT